MATAPARRPGAPRTRTHRRVEAIGSWRTARACELLGRPRALAVPDVPDVPGSVDKGDLYAGVAVIDVPHVQRCNDTHSDACAGRNHVRGRLVSLVLPSTVSLQGSRLPSFSRDSSVYSSVVVRMDTKDLAGVGPEQALSPCRPFRALSLPTDGPTCDHTNRACATTGRMWSRDLPAWPTRLMAARPREFSRGAGMLRWRARRPPRRRPPGRGRRPSSCP